MDKSVKFRIQLETNGQKVLHQLEISAQDFSEAVAEAVKQTQGLESSLKGLAHAGMAFSSVNEALQGLSDMVGSLAGQYNSFEKSMRAAGTMAGLGEEDFAALTQQVKELSAVVPLAREELAAGLYQVISNGVPRDNWLEFLTQSSRSAVGGIADLGQVVTVTSTIIKNYGLSWQDAATVQDKIQMTARNGVTSFEQLASALPRVTGQAAALGVGVDELMAAFATLTGVSGNTAEVSTQLAAIFTALIKPSSEASETAQQMGISFSAASIQAAGGLQQFLSQLQQSVSLYSASSGILEQEVYGKLFGSAEALRALTPITGELSSTYAANVSAMQDSTGTINDSFDQMASTGEAAGQMLRNQLASVTDWAGSLASSAQPTLTFIATTGMAVNSLAMLAATLGKTRVAVVALMAAHRSNIAVQALVATHTKMVALAQRLLAASSVTATAGTWALTAAVTALYAAATLGISVAITALVSLFSRMGDEAEDAADKVDLLRESTDAFSNAASTARADLDMEMAALQRIINGQGDEKRMVEQLNAKYGEAMGCHSSAAEWYKVLVNNSKAYCDQLAYEASAKALASSLAAKQLEKEAKMREWAMLRQQYMDARGRTRYRYDDTVDGKQRYEQLGKDIQTLNSDIASLQTQYDAALKAMAQAEGQLLKTSQQNTQAVSWENASYTRLGELIEQQKKKVGSLAGVNAKAAAEQAKLLKQMEARHKQLGKKYGLDNDTKTTRDKYNGDKLIENARSYSELGNNIRYYKKRIDETAPSETEALERLTRLKQQTERAQESLKALLDEMGRPAEPTTLEDFDKEIRYQQQLRQKASAEQLGAIDREIERLNALRTALEESSHVPLKKEEIRTYKQLETEIAFYERKLKTATETERTEVQKQILALKELKQQWDDTLKAMDVPEDISRLNTMEQLSKAISYYSELQQRASGEEIYSLQKTIDALEQKRKALERLTELPELRRELDELGSMPAAELKLELELIGLDGVRQKIRSLQKMLDDTKNPLTQGGREQVQQMVEQWKDYEKQMRKNNVSFSKTWGNIKGISGGITSITDALQGNGTAWEKTMAVVDGAIAIYEGISGIISIVSALTGVTKLSTVATIADATATGASTTAKAVDMGVMGALAGEQAAVIAANKLATASYLELAAAEYFAAHAAIPFVGFGIAAGFATSATVMTKTIGAMAFADGGLVYGPTLGLVGEYAGAGTNPEVIAPLDKLRGILADSVTDGTAGTSHVEFEIKGRRLVGILEKEARVRRRS